MHLHYYYCSIYFIILMTFNLLVIAEKLDLDTLNNYSEFLNHGDKKLNKLKSNSLENAIFKSKIDIIGEIFKKNIDNFKSSGNLDIVFLVDASSSVGENNFQSELKFVKKLLSDITVDYHHTRVAIITFSSSTNIIKNIDEISAPSKTNNKCLLLNNQLGNITYKGGETFTLGAFQAAKDIFESSNRNDSKKVLFLITDGFSNGGDPVPLANQLKANQITIFTIGIENGNYKELYDVSSQPGEFYSYLLDSFIEFESLARRALHVDLKTGDYIPLGFSSACDNLCPEKDCCDRNALCSCGTTTGHYSCICQPGFYGTGMKNECLPCTPGTYSDGSNLCLPCPDVHHTTVPPALGIESCKCKLGFKAYKNHQCKILKCPKIAIPQHGYLVKKRECGNVLNSACGIRCEVGFTLVGSSIRLCQANGTWSSIDPSCEVRTCTRLSVPKQGTMTCSQMDLGITYDNQINLPVDTVCNFTCAKGRILIGSSERTCLPLAQWDGLKTTCKQIKCNRLPQIKFGKIEPKSCTFGKQEYSKKCTVSCNDGFKLGGASEFMCEGDHGTWNHKASEITCTDVTPPKLECPKNITGATLPGKKFGHVTWIAPNVTDNSGLNVSIWTKPPIMKNSSTNYKFEIGATPVVYFAQDAFQNKAKCKFFVNILDKEPPTIEGCITPPTFLSPDKNGANVTWDEPNIYDNSQNVKINKSHDFGYFATGTTIVTYTAIDPSNNINICKINITIEESHCEDLPNPSFGNSDCNSLDDGVKCVITCLDGYAIPITQSISISNSSTNFICSHSDSIWYNQEGLITPECSITKVADEIEQTGNVSLNSDPDVCNNTEKLTEIKNQIQSILENSICVDNCTISTDTDCEKEQSEEISNRIKRDANFEVVPHRNKTKRRKTLNVKFQVRGKYINTENHTNNTPNNFTIHYQKPKFVCPTGFVPRKNRCVQCPKGTFHNSTKHKCQSCPFGTYNHQVGQTKCISCPIHHSTRKMHCKKEHECKEQCPPGTHARKKLMKHSKHQPNVTIERATLKPYCHSCNIGYYQSDFGKTSCIQCPIGYTTTGFASIDLSQCIPTARQICLNVPSLCHNGTCMADSDYGYTCSCFDGFYGALCENRFSHCDSQPCLNQGTCTDLQDSYKCACKEQYFGQHCEEYREECKLNCANNGTCIQNDDEEFMCLCPDGFGGDFCQLDQSFCKNRICENNSTCVEERNTFRCECKDGFIGRRCNILPCDYRPCKNYFICVNKVDKITTKESFQCVCPDGFTGPKCTEKIDFCKEASCLNNATCLNTLTNYTCSCSDLFYGPNCEFKRNTNYILNFPKYDTFDYIKLNGFQDNLSEISACLWMQSMDNFNYGTIVSYATREFDNAFTITDYTGLVLYINQQNVVTDVQLNDGYWHHICVTWASFEGRYQIFVDGKLIENGTDLATNTLIEGRGNMVIGQEQDIIGGKFSQSEAFMGKMAYIDVWDKALTFQEINIHLNDCNGEMFGTLYAWPLMADHIQGKIEYLNSTFCNKCEEPKPMYNGYIDIIDNTAFYSCYTGFKLNNYKYSNGRKCNKASKWEGIYEPYCKKVYCGHPGYVRNSYTLGYHNYFYLSTITFHCIDGYTLYGTSDITCKADGKWYPEKPQCKGPQCTAFGKPENSQINIISDQSYEDYVELVTNFDIGTQIEVTCDAGAKISGSNIITCLDNATWDFEPPKCNKKITPTKKSKLDCSIDQIPSPPLNGYLDLDSFDAAKNATQDFVIYKCRTGYKLVGENVSTCIIDGYWTMPQTSCESIICEKPPKFPNMVLKYEEIDSGEHISGSMQTYECVPGFRPIGNMVLRCYSDGNWTEMQGKCLKISCFKPHVSQETSIIATSYYFNETVILHCPDKHKYTLKCNQNGIWEGKRGESC